MEKIEKLELAGHRQQIVSDLRSLVEKYRAIFDWDIPEINQGLADKLILAAMHTALEEIQKDLSGGGPGTADRQP
jgi:hypothetical protein